MLGIPDLTRACLFDLDGVLTQTATVHAAAWRQMFDGYLWQRSEQTGEPLVPFDPVADYDRYVDGRTREDGARAFLASRGITLPEGSDSDPPGTPTVRGLASQKNALVQAQIAAGGVAAYPGSVRYLRAVREARLASAVVSASANARAVLTSAGLIDMVDVIVDGVVAREQHLAGKPAPDSYLAAARELRQQPGSCAVFEDALAGVAAGRAGRFGCVVGVDRAGQAADLRANGADVVVTDLAELLDRA
ncbi:MAG: beta-phosphoglucomutase family hydrolase [Actinobacteria bacterium]|nr:beta-phosphoglucomutase family hydrolase [Actinomycetota bacterium]